MLGVAYTLKPSRSRKTRLGLAVSVLVAALVLGCGVSAVRVIPRRAAAAGMLWYAASALRKKPGLRVPARGDARPPSPDLNREPWNV